MDKDNGKWGQETARAGGNTPRPNNRNNNKQRRNRNRGGNPDRKTQEPLYVAPYDAQLLATPLSQLSLSEATLAALTKARLTTVGEVAVKRAQEMYRVQNFGKRNLAELANALHGIGVDFRPPEKTPSQTVASAAAKGNGERKGGKNGSAAAQGKVPVTDGASANRNADKDGSRHKKQRKGAADDGLTLEQVFPHPKFVPSAPTPMPTDDFVKFQRGGKWGFKDKRGKELIPPIYDEVFNFKEDMACVERKQLFGYIDRNNELVIPYRYDCAGSFSGGYACVGDADKCGYINKQGEVVVPFVYDAGMPVTDGKARVKKDGRWGVLSLDTNEIIWN